MIWALDPSNPPLICEIVGMAALKAALGISSPSRYAVALADNVTGTFADAVNDNADAPKSALASLAEPPDAPQRAGGAKQSGRGAAAGGSPTFNFYGVTGAEQAQSRFEEAYTRLLEGDAAMLAGAA